MAPKSPRKAVPKTDGDVASQHNILLDCPELSAGQRLPLGQIPYGHLARLVNEAFVILSFMGMAYQPPNGHRRYVVQLTSSAGLW